MLILEVQEDKHILTGVYENVQIGGKHVFILAGHW